MAFAFPEKCSAERTLAEESSEYDLTGATLAVLSRGSAKVKKHRESGAFCFGTPSGNTPLSSVAFAFPEKCSAERTLAEESSEYDLTGATLAVLSRGSAKVKKHRKGCIP